MTSTDAATVRQAVDQDARLLARRLVRTARFAALAVIEPETGQPLASRVATATDSSGAPTFLISELSSHTPALRADGRCSLLFGEPGKGDPLAHPRITVIGRAERLDRDGIDHDRVKRRFLGRHPRAALYADFADFAFFLVTPQRASLNAGFGKAYLLDDADLRTSIEGMEDLIASETGAIDHMNAGHGATVASYATALCRARAGNWRVASLDRDGLDLICGDDVIRLEFPNPLAGSADLEPTLRALADRARREIGSTP